MADRPSIWNLRWWQGAAVVVAAAAVIIVAAAVIPAWMVNEPSFPPVEEAKRLSAARADVLRILTAIGALLAAVFTYWRIRIAEDVAASSRDQVRASEDQAITERYTRAVEQLADDNVHIQLGGIYALERIMVDSANRRESALAEGRNVPPDDGSTIEQMLRRFVRYESERYRDSLPVDPDNSEPNPEQAADQRNVGAVLSAAVEVLGRRPLADGRVAVDLAGVNLPGINLAKARLHQVNLFGANLFGANLIRADLSDIALVGAQLHGVSLFAARLAGVDMTLAQLHGADLGQADLSGLSLVSADLTDADLTEADMRGADLRGANLSGANMSEVDLRDATWDDTTVWPDGFEPSASG